MDASKRILIAMDDSDASNRAVAYTARMIGGKKGFRIRLFHVLAPLPPKLMEFESAEEPKRDRRGDAKREEAHAQWIVQGKKAAQPVFARAKSILRKARIPAHAVETELFTPGTDKDLATHILEGARVSQCNTIVVGRASFFGLREILRQHVHVADELIQKAQGLSVWVVE
jgi:nucleotide-binding universal stress UspA family protein